MFCRSKNTIFSDIWINFSLAFKEKCDWFSYTQNQRHQVTIEARIIKHCLFITSDYFQFVATRFNFTRRRLCLKEGSYEDLLLLLINLNLTHLIISVRGKWSILVSLCFSSWHSSSIHWGVQRIWHYVLFFCVTYSDDCVVLCDLMGEVMVAVVELRYRQVDVASGRVPSQQPSQSCTH